MGRVRLLILCLAGAMARAQSPIVSQVYGIDFSPYENGQDPNLGSQISINQIQARMQIVAPYTKWVRSFSSTNGLEDIPSVTRQFGLKVAANAWISSDTAQNAIEISNLIAAGNAGLIDIAIVGSEAILRGDVTVNQLLAYMGQVRAAIPSTIPVTTADVYGTFLANPSLIAASDVIFANFYPYWEGTSISNSMCSLETEYAQLVAASGAKPVVISETGWPSAGTAVGAAVPSPSNADLFALQFFTWAGANNISAFYFEAFDEAWKAAYEGPQGAHWGIWDENAVLKPGMNAFFNGQSSVVNCNGTIPGSPGIVPVYMPPYGSSDQMEVQVTGVQPASYVIATFIYVVGTWWPKPYDDQPTVAINPDGTASIKIVTGGTDQNATEIEAFLIPSGTYPTSFSGGKPTLPSAVASFDVMRTQSSISGTISDNSGNPIAGAMVSEPVLGTTTSGPDGKYSFYQIASSGNVTLMVSYPNYSFPTSPAIVAISSGNLLVNFTGIPTVDLAVTSSVSPNPALAGSPVVETIVASNAAPASASDGMVAVSIPASFALVSASTTRGSCNTASSSVNCDVGGLEPTAYATISVVVTPNVAGSFALSASVSGPDPDSNLTNNTTSVTLTVQAPQAITFGPLPGVRLGAAPLTIGATASSGLTVSFLATTTSVCSAAGNVVTILAVGTCSITASQSGNTSYAPAPAVAQSFTVSPRLSACDINGDGTTNVLDVQLIINEALGLASPVNDLNGDVVVNVVDVQLAVNAALGRGCAAT
jgi:exo-beta-1,3-glucanase (GH17 family)